MEIIIALSGYVIIFHIEDYFSLGSPASKYRSDLLTKLT